MVVGGGGPKVIIVSVHVFYIWFTGFRFLSQKKFLVGVGGGGPKVIIVFQVSGFQDRIG